METNINRLELLKEVLKDKEVKQIIIDNNLQQEDIDLNLNTFLAFNLRNKKCKNCKGLENCKQKDRGYKPSLSYGASRCDINYVECDYLLNELEKEMKENNLILISSGLQKHNLDNIYINDARNNVLTSIKSCIANYENNIPTKGLYIHGKHGTGKSYLLSFIAKTFANNNRKVILAYYPDLARSFRSSISSGTLEDLIEDLKNVEVLALDDFGGETLTAYIRDEVIGSILHDRMCNNRLTFIASNLSESMLQKHLEDTGKDIDVVKAARIYERIRALMNFVELVDTNYRD